MNDPGAFRQQVRMAAVQVAGLRPDELAAALAYEVEPFSGIPAAEADLSYNPVLDSDPAVRVYDVAVRRRKGRGGEHGLERWLKPMVAAGCVVLLLAAADFAWLSWRIGRLRKAVAEQVPLDSQIKGIEARVKANRDEAARTRAAREDAALAQARIERLRSAYPVLMDTVAAECGGRMVVKRFAGDGAFSVEMNAVTVSAQVCGEIMAQLTRTAEARGWRMTPGEIHASPHGATVEFSCRFQLNVDENQEGRDGR